MLALWRARSSGIDVATIVTMFDETGERSRSHGVSPLLTGMQAERIGCRVVMPSASWSGYESTFVATLQQLHAEGHDTAVFGDIDLQPHRDWEEKVCAAAGVTPVLPLWGGDRRVLASEAIAIGIRAVVVCVDSRFLTDDFAGRVYDESFIADLPAGVDACGENGEFHTFAVDGPMFSRPLGVAVVARHVYVSPPELGSMRYCFAELAPAT